MSLRVHDGSWFEVGLVGAVTRAGDPGDENVVRVVDEVVACEGVDEVALAAQVRGGDGHELAVAGRRGAPAARAMRPAASGAKSAAATRITGSSLARDASTIAATVAASPTTRLMQHAARGAMTTWGQHRARR